MYYSSVSIFILCIFTACSPYKKHNETDFNKKIEKQLHLNVPTDTVFLGINLNMTYEEARKYVISQLDSNQALYCSYKTLYEEYRRNNKSQEEIDEIYKEMINDADIYYEFISPDTQETVTGIIRLTPLLKGEKRILLSFDNNLFPSTKTLVSIYEKKYGQPDFESKVGKTFKWIKGNVLIEINEKGENTFLSYTDILYQHQTGKNYDK